MPSVRGILFCFVESYKPPVSPPLPVVEQYPLHLGVEEAVGQGDSEPLDRQEDSSYVYK